MEDTEGAVAFVQTPEVEEMDGGEEEGPWN